MPLSSISPRLHPLLRRHPFLPAKALSSQPRDQAKTPSSDGDPLITDSRFKPPGEANATLRVRSRHLGRNLGISNWCVPMASEPCLA
ncbi:hypothetical protein WB44_03180 [Synechococcus sp. WH 8020]|nr:hypothetical protein WB44_03180 [Synechococcus sp. WH 8020]